MKKKIKVMNLIWDMGDGGAQRIVLNYLREFNDDPDIDFKLCVFCGATNSYCNQIILKNKYNVMYLNQPHTSIRIPIIKKIFNLYISRIAWKKAIQEFKPDIVHVHISSLLKNTLFGIIKNNISLRFNTLHSNPYRFKGTDLFYIRKAFRKEKFIPICVTNEQAEIAKKYYGFNKYEIVRNGIEIKKIKNQIISKEQARKLYNLNYSDYVIIGVGRLNKIKRFDLLMDAFEIIAEKEKNAVLLIAGEGEELENLVKYAENLGIKDRVKFIGNQENIVPLYCAADVLGITSTSESASLVLLEAQVCNLRCVISDGVPSESIITNKVKKMDENASIDDWANELLNVNYIGEEKCDINDYDVHYVSKKMKDIYIKYWEEYKNG